MIKILLALPFLAFPSFGSAETFVLDSSVSAATIYGSGATITRNAAFTLPAGQHRLLVDLPRGFNEQTLRILTHPDLEVGAISLRDTRLPPDDREIAARLQIEAQIEQVDIQIVGLENAKTDIGLIIEAANARIALLRAIGTQQMASAALVDGISGTALADLVALVGAETLNALQEAQAAQLDIAEIDLDITTLLDQRKRLEVELEAVALPPVDRVVAQIDVNISTDSSGAIQFRYLTPYAAWTPNYEVSLDTQNGSMIIDRRVALMQDTGESWEDATISVSTSQPSFELSYGELKGRKVSYFTPAPAAPSVRQQSLTSGALIAPEMALMDEATGIAAPGFETNGLNATFTLPAGSELEGDGVETTISVDKAPFDVEITARTATYQQEVAYVFAAFSNDSGLPYLPGFAAFYRDGAFVGSNYTMPSIASGEQADLGFGRIDGLLVERRVLGRETGETGVLTTRNDSIDEYEITVENLTDFDWNVIVYDRVPYSEQEDLQIDQSSLPRPSETNIDGERGVLAWHFPLAIGEENAIRFSYGMEWPAGTELRR